MAELKRADLAGRLRSLANRLEAEPDQLLAFHAADVLEALLGSAPAPTPAEHICDGCRRNLPKLPNGRHYNPDSHFGASECLRAAAETEQGK